MITFVPDVPFCCCMPWHLRHREKTPHGARCFICQRDVAVSAEAKGKRVACIYCGLEHGWLPEIEVPPDGYIEGQPSWVLGCYDDGEQTR